MLPTSRDNVLFYKVISIFSFCLTNLSKLIDLKQKQFISPDIQPVTLI